MHWSVDRWSKLTNVRLRHSLYPHLRHEAERRHCESPRMAERLASIALQAVGGRPKYTGLPNEKELCITSDDLFSLATPPGMPVHTIV